jgi:hypothetical protein
MPNNERERLIIWLRTEWKLEPMEAQDTSLIILADRKAVLDAVERPLKKCRMAVLACTLKEGINKSLATIAKLRGVK